MNFKLICFYISFLLIVINCNGSESKEIQIIDKALGFSMNLPEGFQKLDQEETNKAVNLGKKKLKKLYDVDIDMSDMKPNIFKKDEENYFILSIKDYNVEIDGDYKHAVAEYNIQLYTAYRKNFITAEIDTLTSYGKIDNVDFTKFSVSIDIPHKAKMEVVSYNTYIKNKDFSASIVYLDKDIGEEMVNAIKSAKFKKTAL